MSREEQEKDGFLSPKKFAVITPSKEEEEDKRPKPNRLSNNPFYSLDKEIKFLTIPSLLSPERQGISIMNKNEPTPDGTLSTGTSKVESKIQPEPTFYQLLEELVDEIDLSKKGKPHEIIKGLERQDIMTWRSFLRMNPDDIPGMTLDVNGTQRPLSSCNLRTILTLKHLILKNIREELPGARLASTYTQELFDNYNEDINLKIRHMRHTKHLQRTYQHSQDHHQGLRERRDMNLGIGKRRIKPSLTS